MTLMIELTPEQEARLVDLARQEGLPAEEYARRRLIDTLRGHAMPDLIEPGTMSGAEALEYWRKEGVLGLYADRPDSPEYARALRRQAQTRNRDADAA